VVDVYNREALGVEVALGLPSVRIARMFEQIVTWRGYVTPPPLK